MGGERVRQKYVVMYGDWGGTFNLIAPMKLIRCSKESLENVCSELARLVDGTEDARILDYMEAMPGEWISISDKNRVRAPESIYLYESLVDLGISQRIKGILSGHIGDITEIFSPNLKSALLKIESRDCTQLEFERILVQILHCIKGPGINSERYRGRFQNRYPDSMDLPAIAVGSHYVGRRKNVEQIMIAGECILDPKDIDVGLRILKEIAESSVDFKRESIPRKISSRKPWYKIIKYAVFVAAPHSEIPSSSIRYAKKHGISILPVEGLEELVKTVQKGITIEKLCHEMTPGIF